MPAVQVFSYVQLLCPVSCLLADEAYIASEAAVGRCAPDLVPFFLCWAGLESVWFGGDGCGTARMEGAGLNIELLWTLL